MKHVQPSTADGRTPVGPAPIDTLLRSGRTAKRRRRLTLISAGAIAAVVAGGGTVVAQSMTSDSGHSDRGVAADGHAGSRGNSVTVRTAVAGPGKYHFDSAANVFAIAPTDGVGAHRRATFGPQSFGAMGRWDHVPTGDWTLTASTRPCNGRCHDNLGPPVDTCTADLHITGPTDVVITYYWGQPCEVQVLNAE